MDVAHRIVPPNEVLARLHADRVARTNEVLRRFRDQPHDFSQGATCMHLARAQMVAFGKKPPPMPQFRSPLGAKRALARKGFGDLAELLDSMLPRVAPAQAWVGDLAMLKGDDGAFDALTVVAGGGMVMGWHGSDLSRMHAIRIGGADIIGAWRL